jgi:N-acetylglutamate synthase-like GNAT family acetyltransferase
MTAPRELPTDPAFARSVERCEVDAWMALVESAEGDRKLEHEVIDGATLLLDHGTNWPHSRVLNLGVDKPATADTIARIQARTREAGISRLDVEVSPIARPGTLSRLLTQAGFEQTGKTVVSARHTARMPEPDHYFRLRRGTRDDFEDMVNLMDDVMPGARDWCMLLASQVDREDWRYNMAMEEGVVCGLAGMHYQGNIAWLSPIWVREAYRNRGTQAALIAHSVRSAEADGIEWVVTTYPVTPQGRTRNFDRAGFAIVYLRNHFTWELSGE